MLHLLITNAIFFTDLACKNKIASTPKEELPKKILSGAATLDYSENKGMMLNLGEEKPELVKIFSGLSFLILAGFYIHLLFQKGHFFAKLGLSFVTGGALSNVYDHLKRGYVIDYLRFPIKRIKHIVFNIGDLFIFAGGIILILRELFHK